MGATKSLFNDSREKELSQSELEAKKRSDYRKRVISLIDQIEETEKESQQILNLLDNVWPYRAFDQFILTVGKSPKWFIKKVLDKYSNNDTYTMRQINRVFLENKFNEG